jgi:hypothetical protein
MGTLGGWLILLAEEELKCRRFITWAGQSCFAAEPTSLLLPNMGENVVFLSHGAHSWQQSPPQEGFHGLSFYHLKQGRASWQLTPPRSCYQI